MALVAPPNAPPNSPLPTLPTLGRIWGTTRRVTLTADVTVRGKAYRVFVMVYVRVMSDFGARIVLDLQYKLASPLGGPPPIDDTAHRVMAPGPTPDVPPQDPGCTPGRGAPSYGSHQAGTDKPSRGLPGQAAIRHCSPFLRQLSAIPDSRPQAPGPNPGALRHKVLSQ